MVDVVHGQARIRFIVTSQQRAHGVDHCGLADVVGANKDIEPGAKFQRVSTSSRKFTIRSQARYMMNSALQGEARGLGDMPVG